MELLLQLFHMEIGNQESSATLILFPLVLNVLVTGSTLYFVYQPMPFGDLVLMFAVGTRFIRAIINSKLVSFIACGLCRPHAI